MSKYPRLVSWSYHSGVSSFSRSNTKERLQKVYITSPAGESILEDGKLACLTRAGISLLGKDPYFEVVNEVGYTSRAKKHRDMERNMRENYPELRNKVSGFKSMLRDYNEYVYLDLPFIDNYVNPIVKSNPAFHTRNFIKKDLFDKDLIIELIEYKPQAAMGGTISSYRNKELPKLMSELKIKFPTIYDEVLSESEWLQELDSELTLVGKHALLTSLNPGPVLVEEDILEYVEYYWDGSELTSDKKIRNGAILNKKISNPPSNMIVKICDDSVVSPNIKLVE